MWIARVRRGSSERRSRSRAPAIGKFRKGLEAKVSGSFRFLGGGLLTRRPLRSEMNTGGLRDEGVKVPSRGYGTR